MFIRDLCMFPECSFLWSLSTGDPEVINLTVKLNSAVMPLTMFSPDQAIISMIMGSVVY